MMELREQIARAICGNWIVGDDRPWQQWTEEADAVLEVLAKQEPVAWLDDGTCRSGSHGTTHRVITDATKRDMPPAIADSFATPLYAAPGAQAADVQVLIDALELCRFALEPYDDVKPRNWKTDRERLRVAHEIACETLAKVAPKPENE